MDFVYRCHNPCEAGPRVLAGATCSGFLIFPRKRQDYRGSLGGKSNTAVTSTPTANLSVCGKQYRTSASTTCFWDRTCMIVPGSRGCGTNSLIPSSEESRSCPFKWLSDGRSTRMERVSFAGKRIWERRSSKSRLYPPR